MDVKIDFASKVRWKSGKLGVWIGIFGLFFGEMVCFDLYME